MIKTAEQGLEIYRNEMKEYWSWLQSLEKRYKKPMDKIDPLKLGDSDYDQLNEWRIKIITMKKILNIDEMERQRIDEEIQKELGIPI